MYIDKTVGDIFFKFGNEYDNNIKKQDYNIPDLSYFK